MLEHQTRLINDLKRAAVPLLEGERLVERQPEFAGDHVDRAGQQIGFQGGGVLDRAHRDSPERNGRARPMGVRLEHDVRPGRDLADTVGSVIEAGVGRVGGIPGLHPVLRRVGEGGPLDMRRQHDEVVDRGIVEGQLVEMHREGLVVLRVDSGEPAIQLGIADGALPVAPDLVGEQHVGGRDRDAVTPGRVGSDRVGEIDALTIAGQIDRHGATVLDGGKLGA